MYVHLIYAWHHCITQDFANPFVLTAKLDNSQYDPSRPIHKNTNFHHPAHKKEKKIDQRSINKYV